MGCNNSKFIDIKHSINNINEDIKRLEHYTYLLHNDINKDITYLRKLNTIDTTVHQCYIGTLSGILPELGKQCLIKLTILDLNAKTHNENQQWLNTYTLPDIIIDKHINGLFHYHFHYGPYMREIGQTVDAVTSNPFCLDYMYYDYIASYKVTLEIVCDTDNHYKYLTKIINWLVKKNIWDQSGSNIKTEFVWSKSLVKI